VNGLSHLICLADVQVDISPTFETSYRGRHKMISRAACSLQATSCSFVIYMISVDTSYNFFSIWLMQALVIILMNFL